MESVVEWLCHQTELNESTHEDIIWAIKKAKKMEEEIEQAQDAKRLLFFYKVSLIIGLEKAGKLLKEVEKEIKQ